jgi:hypothetical protein
MHHLTSRTFNEELIADLNCPGVVNRTVNAEVALVVSQDIPQDFGIFINSGLRYESHAAAFRFFLRSQVDASELQMPADPLVLDETVAFIQIDQECWTKTAAVDGFDVP